MWLNRFEYKYGRYSIPGLAKYLTIGRVVMYLLITALPDFFLQNALAPLSIFGLSRGRIWELLTFIITPPMSSPLSFLIDTYFFYFIATALESIWGDFKFNIYILFSMLAGIVSCLLVGVGTATYLSTLMFIAFAIYYPSQQLLLFFVLPIQAKYLGWVAGFLLLIDFLGGSWFLKVNIFFACLALLAFFGKGLIQNIKTEIQAAKRRNAWKKANQRYR